MSYLSSNELKLGESATASQNFKVTTNNDGTLVISRADGSQTVGTINAAGVFSPLQATTAGAPAYTKGYMYFDTTLNKLRIGGATAWETITSV